jgi:tetratricopeptide (TPR) repeat protein
MARASATIVLAIAILTGSAPARAQSPEPPRPDAPSPGEPAPAYDPAKAVDDLLVRLAKTDDPQAARRIAAAVQALWSRSGSDTVDLLVSRATEAQRAQKLDVAIRLMDEVVGMKPDYAEGWNRRATLKFVAKDLDDAMSDIHETLIREPRHYVAWIALGRILSDSGFDAKALAAYRKALEIYPAIEGLKKQVEDLTLKVEGQPI